MTMTQTSSTAAKTPTIKPANRAKPQRRMARPLKGDAEPTPPAADVLPLADTATVATSTTTPPSSAPRAGSKSAAVIALLEREQGATIAEMIAAIGWLPHTTRAALTGLKKKGHVIERDNRGDVTCYRIVKTA